ncbi:unnamed protein product [Rhodiola kirilowii]
MSSCNDAAAQKAMKERLLKELRSRQITLGINFYPKWAGEKGKVEKWYCYCRSNYGRKREEGYLGSWC